MKRCNLHEKCLGFERLELRMLLNGSMEFTPDPELIQWLSQESLAEPHRWIVQIDDSSVAGANRFAEMQAILDNAWATARFEAATGNPDFQNLAHPGPEPAPEAKPTVDGWLNADGLYTLECPKPLNSEQLLSVLQLIPGLCYAEPDVCGTLSATPNDTHFGEQWGLHNIGQEWGMIDADIDAPEAWDVTMGSGDVVVAVLDSGVDYTHPDLYLNIWLNQGEIPSGLGVADTDSDGQITFYDLNHPDNSSCVSDLNGTGYIDAGDLLNDSRWVNGLNEDGNGNFTDDLCGWDFYDNNNDPADDVIDASSHGTHIAGIIGAVANNQEGVSGVCPNVKLMALKVVRDDGRPYSNHVKDALDYVHDMRTRIQHGVNVFVTNNSYSFPYSPYGLSGKISLHEQAGILFVTSAGNRNVDLDETPYYPAAYNHSNIISVAGTNQYDELYCHSNWGAEHVDLAAPGEDICSTTRGGGYGLNTGTSMAAPFVAGAAALLWDIDLDATYQ